MRLDKLTKIAVTALEDIKARDILVLDVRKQTSLYDTLIIATAESARQTKALANNVREEVKAAGGSIIGTEGEDSGDWVLVDCADFVVHIMQPNVRTYYNLEELWTPPAPTREPKLPVAKKAAPKLKPPAVAKPVVAEKPAAKKSVAKKPAAKKTAVKATVKAPAAKKPVVKKVAAKKAVAAKAPAVKKVAAKKTTPAAVKKPAVKKAGAAKAPVATVRRRLKAK
jgi:ribosome-associated protein